MRLFVCLLWIVYTHILLHLYMMNDERVLTLSHWQLDVWVVLLERLAVEHAKAI